MNSPANSDPLSTLIVDVANLLGSVMIVSLREMPRPVQSMVYTLSKTAITSMMMLGRKELAKLPQIRAVLLDAAVPPPLRLIQGLTALSVASVPEMAPTTIEAINTHVRQLGERIAAYQQAVGA